jgi:hypothetical protein
MSDTYLEWLDDRLAEATNGKLLYESNNASKLVRDITRILETLQGCKTMYLQCQRHPLKTPEEVMSMRPDQVRVKFIGQNVLLSALSQMIWREVDKYDNEGLDEIGELLRPYHPDPRVKGEE